MLARCNGIIVLVFLFFSAAGQPQLAIPLATVHQSANIKTMTNLIKNNTNNDLLVVYKGMPSTLTSYIIKTLDLQTEQGVYELYLHLKGEMPVEVLAEGLRGYCSLEDTSKLSRIRTKHFVSFLVGRDNNEQVVVIGDTNNNYDFSDDSLFVFPFFINAKPMDYFRRANFYYQYVDNGKIVDDSVFLGLYTRSSTSNFKYSNPIEQEFFLTVSLEEYKVGLLKVGDSPINIKIVLSQFPAAIYDKINSKIFFDLNEWDRYYTVGDSVYFGNRKYLIEDIASSGDTLYLSSFENKALPYGIYPGNYAYNVTSKDFLTNASFDLNKFSNKYVLLDFWGSWCEPCIRSIPDLVDFSRKYRDKLHIVSIAEDDESRKDLLKSIIKSKGMTWTHLFENLRDTSENTIDNKYKVNSYPTQILISPEGKIIYRSGLNSKLTEKDLDSLLKL
jgi:thiol-disulfide isomerase/thioredoxin